MARQLTEKELEARKEIVIPIKPKELWNAYTKYIYEKPLEGLTWLAKKLDDVSVSKKLRSGPLAFLGMPAGIIGRNSSRAVAHLANGKYLHTAQWLGGGAAALASWYVAGTALASSLGSTAVAAIGGKIAVTAIAAAVTVPVMVPAAMLGVAGFSVAVGAVIAGLSVFPGALNLITGTRRSIDYAQGIRGVDYDGAKEKKEIDYNSLRAIEQRKTYQEISYKLGSLTEEQQKDIYETLAQRFAKVAAKPAQQDDDVQLVAQPGAKAGVTVTPKP
ncbi:MAG TPA: hypothetical protein VEF76_02710 [Patescibacteria group bacterium]|nr:hypothetical protein [Patescibacteria group bacterium]